MTATVAITDLQAAPPAGRKLVDRLETTRRNGHPATGRVTRLPYDPTPTSSAHGLDPRLPPNCLARTAVPRGVVSATSRSRHPAEMTTSVKHQPVWRRPVRMCNT